MAPLPLTCGGVKCAGVEPGKSERLLGRVEAGARNLEGGNHETFLLTSPVPNPQTPKPGDWGCLYNHMGHTPTITPPPHL